MAAAPSGASSTSYPARSKAFRSIARSSFLSSTRRRGSISLVSTTNPAVVRELRVTSVQRREAAHLHDQADARSEEHTSELQSLRHLVCRLLLVKNKQSHRN